MVTRHLRQRRRPPIRIRVQLRPKVCTRAESSSNHLKYAKVESNYVVFDQTKDAYIEMKKVNSPVTGEVTITIVYSNGSGKPADGNQSKQHYH